MAAPLLLLCLAATPPHPLDGVVDAVRAAAKDGGRPVVVLDLDSTLFDNAARTKHILLEVAARKDALRPLLPKIAELPEAGLPYLVTDILALAGITEASATSAFLSGWKRRFFTDAYQLYDRPTPGAVDFVRAVHAEGATLVYLTGRDAPGMGAGAVRSLRRFGFPVLTPTAILVMKPGFREPDETFKAEAVATVDALGTVVATFENEPRNANLFAKTWPKAQSFFLTTNSNPEKVVPLAEALVEIPDFTRSAKAE